MGGEVVQRVGGCIGGSEDRWVYRRFRGWVGG